MFRWARCLWLSPVCAAAVACTSSGSEDAGSQLANHSGSLALVSLERFEAAETALPRLVASAKFARFHGIQGDALLQLLGAETGEVESCRLESGLGQLDVPEQARVELLSVGDLSVRLGDNLTTLPPRLFPALATTASGFFYAGDAELVAPRAELDEYTISARGEEGLGAFEIVAASPGEPLGLNAQGALVDRVLELSRGHDLALTWEPEDPHDRIEFELYAGGSVLACACRDDGHFVLPKDQLSALEGDDDASVVVRRVRVVPIELSGIEAGYARLATTRTLDALVR